MRGGKASNHQGFAKEGIALILTFFASCDCAENGSGRAFCRPMDRMLSPNGVLYAKVLVVKQNALLPADGAEHCLRKTMLTAVPDRCASKLKPALGQCSATTLIGNFALKLPHEVCKTCPFSSHIHLSLFLCRKFLRSGYA